MQRIMLIRRASDLGAAVARARQIKGLTQQQAAERINIERSYLAKMEAGASVLLVERALQLLRRLGAEVTVTLPDDLLDADRDHDGRP